MNIQAKVTWFDIRSGVGIAEDSNGHEYYLSKDCCTADLKHGEHIQGIPKSYGKTIGLVDVKRT